MKLIKAWRKDLATATDAVATDEANLDHAKARGDKEQIEFCKKSLGWSRSWKARAERSAYPHGKDCRCERCKC